MSTAIAHSLRNSSNCRPRLSSVATPYPTAATPSSLLLPPGSPPPPSSRALQAPVLSSLLPHHPASSRSPAHPNLGLRPDTLHSPHAWSARPPSLSPLLSAPSPLVSSRRDAMRNGLLGLLGLAGGWLPGLLRAGPAAARAKNKEIEEVLKKAEWPQQFPFRAEDFQRYDETPDSMFYSMPRFVTHIDDDAIRALTKYYEAALPPSNSGAAVLDMCSSWVSHYPKNYKQGRIVGLGMNEEELSKNKVLTEYVVQDLNRNPTLPFEDNTFDVITNAVSVDYLSRPLEVFQEMRRVLKPGGLAAMSFSNRCFWTKAISIWTSTGDVDHILIVGSYFHYAGGFEPPQALDISPNPGRTDPMYVVFSRKLEA